MRATSRASRGRPSAPAPRRHRPRLPSLRRAVLVQPVRALRRNVPPPGVRDRMRRNGRGTDRRRGRYATLSSKWRKPSQPTPSSAGTPSRIETVSSRACAIFCCTTVNGGHRYRGRRSQRCSWSSSPAPDSPHSVRRHRTRRRRRVGARVPAGARRHGDREPPRDASHAARARVARLHGSRRSPRCAAVRGSAGVGLGDHTHPEKGRYALIDGIAAHVIRWPPIVRKRPPMFRPNPGIGGRRRARSR